MTIKILKQLRLTVMAIALIALATPNCTAQTIAYTDVTLETMTKEGQIKNGTLVIQGDKIVDVGKDIKIPDDARVISLAGKTIMPGMVDPYFVFRTSSATGSQPQTITVNGRTFTINRGTTQFSAGSFTRIGEYFYPYKFDFKPAIRTGITVGNFVSNGRGLSAYANVSDEKTSEMIFKDEGFLFAQVTNQTGALDIIRKPLTTEVKKTTTTSSKSSTTKTSASTSATGSEKPSAADQEKALWASVKSGKSPLFLNANNAATVAYILKFLEDHEKVKLNLVTTGSNIYELLDDIKANKNITVVLTPSIDQVPYTSDLMNVPKMLVEKGIPFAFSMSMNGSQMRGGQDDPMFPLAMLVRTGLNRETALKSVTLKPAQLMDIEKTHGSLAKDKMANLLIFDGDPLATGSRLQKVILNGKTIHEN